MTPRPGGDAHRMDRLDRPFADACAAGLGLSPAVAAPVAPPPRRWGRRIALGLRKLRNKNLENPWKKHDNIPL